MNKENLITYLASIKNAKGLVDVGILTNDEFKKYDEHLMKKYKMTQKNVFINNDLNNTKTRVNM